MKVIKPNNLSQLDGSFKRASTATYIDGGVLKYAAINEPRFQDGILLLEKRATNFFKASEDFLSGFWAKNQCSVTQSGVGPDGTSNKSYLIQSNNLGNDFISQMPSIPINNISIATFLVKNNNSVESRIFVRSSLDGAIYKIFWNSTEITNMEFGGGTTEPIDRAYGWTDLANGWKIVWCKYKTSENNQQVRFYPSSISNGSSVFLGGADVKIDIVPTSYIPTTTTAVTREPDCVAGNFTRASVGTYIDNGILKNATTDEPRFQDGVLLLEKESTNLLLYSSQFEQTNWVKSNATISLNNFAAPDGSVTADKLAETTTSGVHNINQVPSILPSNNTHTFSVFIRAAGRTAARIGIQSAASNAAFASFDLINNLTDSFSIGDYSNVSSSITSIADGWFLCSITVKLGADTSWGVYGVQIRPESVYKVTQSYIGDTSLGLHLWGAQLEVGSLTSYIPTTTVAVTRAADIELPSIAYSNATDSNSLWSSGTTYSAGQKVRYLSKIYESLVGSNLNNIPSNTPLSWLDLGADNIHAMIDGIVNTPTKRTENLRVILRPGQFNSLALIDMNATISTASVYDSNTYELIYSNKAGLSGTNVYDWYQYFFYSPTTERSQYVLTGIPTNPNVIIALDLNVASTEEVSVGQLTIGLSEDLGGTQYGAKAGIVDYSKKSTDEFGTITFVERPYSKKLEAEIYFANSQMNRIHRYLTSIRATPVVWIASDDPTFEEAMVIYGFYKDFSTTISYPSHSLCNLQIEGLT